MPGQVIGGRWKPLHYVLRRTLFTDIICQCAADGTCYIRNDAPVPASITGTIELVQTTRTQGAARVIQTIQTDMPAGAASTYWFCLNQSAPARFADHAGGCSPLSALLPQFGCLASGADCILRIRVCDLPCPAS